MRITHKTPDIMKKLLIFLTALLLMGCLNPDTRQPTKIIQIHTTSGGCEYFADSGPDYEYLVFRDDCGKFNVGDTIQIVKR